MADSIDDLRRRLREAQARGRENKSRTARIEAIRARYQELHEDLTLEMYKELVPLLVEEAAEAAEGIAVIKRIEIGDLEGRYDEPIYSRLRGIDARLFDLCVELFGIAGVTVRYQHAAGGTREWHELIVHLSL